MSKESNKTFELLSNSYDQFINDNVRYYAFINKESFKIFQSNIKLSVIVYESNSLFKTLNDNYQLSSQIIKIETNIKLNPVNGSLVNFKFKESDDQTRLYKCVFWDFNLRNGQGDWNEFGCFFKNGSCFCNHTTNFAMIIVSYKTYTECEDINYLD